MDALKILLLFLLPVVFSSCKEKLDPHSVVETNRRQIERTELDDWIHANLVTPYNVEVQYRWDRTQQEKVRMYIRQNWKRLKTYSRRYVNSDLNFTPTLNSEARVS